MVPGSGVPLMASAGEKRPVRIASATSAALTAPLDRPRPAGELALPVPRQAAQFLHHGVQPHAGDELHDVVVMAVVLSHAEDRHDVGVVQPRAARARVEPQYLLPSPRAASGKTFSATRRPSDSCSAS